MDRKKFIKTCTFACLGTSAFTTLLQSCATTNYYAKIISNNKQITISKSEFTKIENNKTTLRKYVLVKQEHLNFPICVFKLSENNFSAVLMECTHRSCELHNQGDYLQCPCHGSEFDNKGIVQTPPAEQNLKTFITTIDNENIYIEL